MSLVKLMRSVVKEYMAFICIMMYVRCGDAILYAYPKFGRRVRVQVSARSRSCSILITTISSPALTSLEIDSMQPRQ